MTNTNFGKSYPGNVRASWMYEPKCPPVTTEVDHKITCAEVDALDAEGPPARNPQRTKRPGRRGREIMDMGVGETGWCVPWALNRGGTNGLSPHFTIYGSSFGTVQMFVARTAGGFVVSVLGKFATERVRLAECRCCSSVRIENGKVQLTPGIEAQLKVVAGLMEDQHKAQGTGDAGPLKHKLRAENKRLAAMYAAQLEEEAQAEREAQELLLLADRSRPPRWDPLGVAPFAWHLPEPGPPPPPPLTRSERIRDILLVGINGLIALAWEVGKSWLQALRTLVVLSAKVLVFPFRMFGRLLKWVGPVVLWRTAVTALAASLVAGGFGRQDVQISLLGASLLLLLAAVLASYAKPRKRSSRSRCSTCGRFVSGYSGYCDSCRASDTDLLDAFGEMDAATGQIADRITDLQRQISDLQSGLPCEVCGDMGVVTTEPRRRCKVCQERAARPTRWMGAY